ncbi:MAG: GTP-binding protein [Gammaproteobacteria bacterium]|nr:MAG: GTP-binding protein [Gammaproteobacteria bacterium]
MQEYKIIFAGSMGAGKTTSIQAISDNEIISTDVVNTDKEAHSKLLTTVGIDYGQIMLPPDTKIALYGTPGQERFQLVWNIVTQGALGAIILIDSTSEKAPAELPFYVDYFYQNGLKNIVVGLTHTDISNGHLTLDDCFDVLSKHDFVFPVFAVDSREKGDVLLLIESLLASIEATIS